MVDHEEWWFYDAEGDHLFIGLLDELGVWIPGREWPMAMPGPNEQTDLHEENLYLISPVEVPHG